MTEILEAFLGKDALALSATVLALIIVWIPFSRGLRIVFQGWAATRSLDAKAVEAGLCKETSEGVEPVGLLMVRIFRSSLRDREQSAPEFLFDASRQYVMSEFDLYYSRPITMFANLMPPIGFIGTTISMLILFISMHKADSALELGALAGALTSSIFALIAYAILEAIKIRLHTRLLACLRRAEAHCDVPQGPVAAGRRGCTNVPGDKDDTRAEVPA